MREIEKECNIQQIIRWWCPSCRAYLIISSRNTQDINKQSNRVLYLVSHISGHSQETSWLGKVRELLGTLRWSCCQFCAMATRPTRTSTDLAMLHAMQYVLTAQKSGTIWYYFTTSQLLLRRINEILFYNNITSSLILLTQITQSDITK